MHLFPIRFDPSDNPSPTQKGFLMSDLRPDLTPDLAADDFRAFYWLKEELLQFCREQSIGSQGSKQELAERIAHFLETGEKKSSVAKSQHRKMPASFTADTIIEVGWRCSEDLRAFFEAEIGSHFHFNQLMRDFIKQEHGKTLREAMQAWQSNHAAPVKTAIASQFEYNQHTRDYYEKNPDATRAEVIASWKALRAQRRS